MSDPGFPRADDDLVTPHHRPPSWVVATCILLTVALAAVFAVPAIGTWYAVAVGDNQPVRSRLRGPAEPDRGRRRPGGALRPGAADRGRWRGDGDGSVWVGVVQACPETHPDRAEILITYPGGTDRERIEAILAEESFGVPVSLLNV